MIGYPRGQDGAIFARSGLPVTRAPWSKWWDIDQVLFLCVFMDGVEYLPNTSYYMFRCVVSLYIFTSFAKIQTASKNRLRYYIPKQSNN